MSDALFAEAPTLVPETPADVSGNACEQCGNPFEPRKGSGGKPQRFCSTDCRITSNAQRSQRSPTCDAPIEPAAVIPLPQPETRGETFSWDAENVDVVLRKQPLTAIYLNPWDQVVIRQENEADGPQDDPFVHFEMHNLPAIINRLTVIFESWKRDQEQRR